MTDLLTGLEVAVTSGRSGNGRDFAWWDTATGELLASIKTEHQQVGGHCVIQHSCPDDLIPVITTELLNIRGGVWPDITHKVIWGHFTDHPRFVKTGACDG